MKILLVEDDPATRALLEKALAVDYLIESVTDGRSALNFIEQFEYDLLILDIGIPDLDGLSICQHLRAQGCEIPILLLTAKDGIGDRVLGLDSGADDYVAKPFHLPELLARIRALLRRGRATVASILTCEHLRLDCLTHEAHYQDQLLHLTPKEYGILELLLLNPQRIFSRSAIIDRLWELNEPPTENVVSSHIKAIRHKLKAAGAQQDLIETIYGFGYRLRSLDMTEADPEPARVEDVAAALMAKLWEQFKDSFSTQLNVLDQVMVALQTGTLTPHLQHEAKQTAHKLVGSLGVYGLPQGSVLAKQIEDLLWCERPLVSAEQQQIMEWLQALRQELQQKLNTVADPTPHQPAQPLVLVVDADSILTEQLQVEASDHAVQMKVAADPIVAHAMLDRGLPDVILLDLTENYQDGLNWLQILQQLYPEIPVLVLTGRDSLSDRLTVSRLGAKQFLHKPATPEQIFQAIGHLLPQIQASEARVLVVDDDSAVLALLSTLLTPWGLEVITLDQPERFWDVLVTTSPHLILLDLEMPQVSGLELCQIVRQDAQWGHLPILVVTAHRDTDSLQQAFAAGADDFIMKPVIGPELVTRVLSRIERTRLLQRLGHPDPMTRRAEV